MPPTLPFELATAIVEAASEADGVRTPKACALVSALWRAASRPVVLRRLRVTCERRLEELGALLARDPAIAPLVRCLVFRDECCRPGATHSYFAELPAELPAQLPNLDALEFAGIRAWFAAPGGPHAPVLALPVFPTVRRLALRGCTADAAVLDALAARLPALHTLSLAWITVPKAAPDAPLQHDLAHSRGPSLRELELDMGHVFASALQHILPWVQSTPSRTTLRALTLTLRISDAEPAGRFLHDIGPQLESLELRFEEYFGLPLETTNIKAHIPVKDCTGLHSLTLFDPNPTSTAIMSSMAEICSPCIRRLSLRVTSTGCDGITGPRLPSLSLLAQPLTGDNLKCLTDLSFIHHGPMGANAVANAVRADVPEVAARGIVRVLRWM